MSVIVRPPSSSSVTTTISLTAEQSQPPHEGRREGQGLVGRGKLRGVFVNLSHAAWAVLIPQGLGYL